MRALSPLVEKFGLVLPNLNGPNSGCPTDPQPCGSLARLRMSDQPIGLAGYPSASARGFGMAITSGVTMNGSPPLTIAPCPASMRFWLTTAPHDDAAGDHTTGRGPLIFSSQFVNSSVAAAPDDFFCGR